MVMLNSSLSRPGCVLAYRDTPGERLPVVFLHGAGADHVMFAAQAAALERAGHRVIVWDLRSHGQSRPNTAPLTADLLVDDLEALTSALGLERPALVGHSLGGNIAQAVVRRSGSSYAGLAVLDSAWNTGPLSWVERRLLALAAPGLALIPAGKLAGVMADASAVSLAARTDLRRAFTAVPKRDFLDIWRATTAFVDPDPGYRAPIPLCLVRGEQDTTGNIAAAMPAWAAHEGVSEHVVPNAGHVVTQDAPAAVTEILRSFLAQLS